MNIQEFATVTQAKSMIKTLRQHLDDLEENLAKVIMTLLSTSWLRCKEQTRLKLND